MNKMLLFFGEAAVRIMFELIPVIRLIIGRKPDDFLEGNETKCSWKAY